MIVVILARTVDEGRSHARLAGLADSDVIIPGSAGGIDGMRLTAADLVIELPGFDERRGASTIRDSLLTDIDRRPEDDRPLWHRIEAP